jgi:hypothetical protein
MHPKSPIGALSGQNDTDCASPTRARRNAVEAGFAWRRPSWHMTIEGGVLNGNPGRRLLQANTGSSTGHCLQHQGEMSAPTTSPMRRTRRAGRSLARSSRDIEHPAFRCDLGSGKHGWDKKSGPPASEALICRSIDGSAGRHVETRPETCAHHRPRSRSPINAAFRDGITALACAPLRAT